VIEPRDLLTLATELSNRSDEAALRAAVSRAYYAAFLHCQAVVAGHHGVRLTATGRDHALVADAVFRLDETASQTLERLRRRRNEADYDTDATVDGPAAALACLLAEACFQLR
jgi:uncharacterized protein (UPF0332 family)